MTVTEAPTTAAKPERWTAQWKELYDEVVTSGLCTGCAGCVIACPHDVLGYDHDERRLQAVPPRGRARPGRLHPRREGLHVAAPGPAPASGRGSPRSTSTCSAGSASPTSCRASTRTSLSPGPSTTRSTTIGQDGGLVSAHAHLAARARLHRRRPRVVPRGRRLDVEGHPRRRRAPRRRSSPRPAAATPTRPTRWRYTEALDGGAEQLALVGMSCQSLGRRR